VEYLKVFWDGITAEGKDFVKRLLKVVPEERYSAEEALQHPWFKAPKPDFVIEVVYSHEDLCTTTGEIMKKDKGTRVIDVDVR